MADIMAGLVQ